MTLSQSVKHYKETEEGRGQMCEAVEKYAKEYVILQKDCRINRIRDFEDVFMEESKNRSVRFG